MDDSMEAEFKEMMFSRMPRELDILRSAAATINSNTIGAMIMFRLYFPTVPADRASSFMRWLSTQKCA